MKALIKEYKIGIAIFAIAVLFFISLSFAYSHELSPNYQISKGTALGIATAQHNFDMGTNKLQGSVGLGTFQGVDALSFSLGKRYKDVLINGSVGSENGHTGFGAGATWRF